MDNKSRVLFILKRREDYNAITHSHIGLSTGLYNSANFMNEMLNENGIESNLVVVHDNNCIDREVTKYKPTHVIIEALWVVPEKFDILQRLHPKVKWIIRMHSETPFIANEGNAMKWLAEYTSYENLYIGCNAPRFLREIRYYTQVRNRWSNAETRERIIYLPNYYPTDFITKPLNRKKDTIDIGCFGAIRPLKNHLLQAMAAVEFAEQIDKKLRFHVNVGRIEMKGQPVFHNLEGMFGQLANAGHELVNNQWSPREDFLKICHSMDIGLQVSFSETFNIVGADLISQGVPLVGSTEIPWLAPQSCADPTNSSEIVKKLHKTYNWPGMNIWFNQRNLANYSNNTRKIWVKYFK